MILGLPIVGHPITGNIESAGWRDRVEEYLGALLDSGKTNGSHHFGEPPAAGADDLTVERAARAYVLYVLGSTLFPDGTGIVPPGCGFLSSEIGIRQGSIFGFLRP